MSSILTNNLMKIIVGNKFPDFKLKDDEDSFISALYKDNKTPFLVFTFILKMKHQAVLNRHVILKNHMMNLKN